MSLKFCTNCGHQLKDGDKVCPNCGTTILNDDLSIDEQLDMLKNDVKDDVLLQEEEKKKDEDIKIIDDRVDEKSSDIKITDDRKEEEIIPEKIVDDRKEEKTTTPKVVDDRTEEKKTPDKVDDKTETENVDNKDKNKKTNKKDNDEDDKSDKKDKNKNTDTEVNKKLESKLTKTIKIICGILSFLILFAAIFGALILEAKTNTGSTNYLTHLLDLVKVLDGNKFSISLVTNLIFSLVAPVIFIIMYFINQFVVSIKIFKVGRNTNRSAVWEVLMSNLIYLFIVRMIANSMNGIWTSFNPLNLLMIPVCINLVFYVFLYFFKLFKDEIGTFRFASAKSSKLLVHRIIQSVTVLLLLVLVMINVELTTDGVIFSFKPFGSIRHFLNDGFIKYIDAASIIPSVKPTFLLEQIFMFLYNMFKMMLEVSVLIGIINTVYRFVVRDAEEEYFNDCFFVLFKSKFISSIVTTMILLVCSFVCVYIYVTGVTDSIIDINFGTCVTLVLPYLVSLIIVIVLSIVNSIFSSKWMKQVKE